MSSLVHSTTTSSILASLAKWASAVDAPSVTQQMVSLQPRIARQHASSAGASRAALIAAPHLRQRQHWTVAPASLLDLQLHASSLLSQVRALLMSRVLSRILPLWARLVLIVV